MNPPELPNLTILETPNITPGDWFFVPGDSPESPLNSSDLAGLAPGSTLLSSMVCVMIPGCGQGSVELATVWYPVHGISIQDLREGDEQGGSTTFPGDMNQNGLLMAGAPGLLKACQTLLKDLYNERQRLIQEVVGPPENPPGPSTMRRIQEQIAILEPAITKAVVFPSGD